MNFYHSFVQKFSAVAAPLSALTKGTSYKFLWRSEAEEAFKELKCRFNFAPILTLPDLEKTFVVEVDASDVGVGAILSQQGVGSKLSICPEQCLFPGSPVGSQLSPYLTTCHPGAARTLDFLLGKFW